MTRAVVTGVTVFVAAAGASVLMTSWSSPPWVPLALLGLSGILAVLAGGMAWLSGLGRGGGTAGPTKLPDSRPDHPREEGMPPPRGGLDWLQVDAHGRKRLLPAGDLDWIEAAGNYVRLHSGEDSFLYRASLGNLAAVLDPSRFVRIHKSAIVNLDAVRVVDPLSTGDAVLELRSGEKVRMSRRFADGFNQRTGRSYGYADP